MREAASGHTLVPALPLRTERLVLRAFTLEDFDALYAYQSRADVARFLPWGPRTADEVRTALGTKIDHTSITSEGDFLALAAVRADTDELIGDFILGWVSAEHGLGEIGYIVHPDHAGHGFATEGGREMLRLAFEELHLHRVIGRLEARNTASARVLEKLGMRLEAHLIENEYFKGEWQSELLYAILDRDWAELQTSARRGGHAAD